MAAGPPPNYYAILEISESASTQQVRDAYKRAALKTHPDRVPADSPERASRTRKFQLVNDAYFTLSDTTRRREYDSQRKLFGGGFSRGSGGASSSGPTDSFATDDEPASAAPGSQPGAAQSAFSWAWNYFTQQQQGGGAANQSGAAGPQPTREQAQNAQFGDVFEEMLREEGLAEENGTANGRFWGLIGGGSGAALGFIVANVPGALAGAVAGNRLGAIRDAKGKSVYSVFQGVDKVRPWLDVLKYVGIVQMDTAELYGSSEKDLGELGAGEQGFSISTKNIGGWKPGHLKQLKQSHEASLEKLKHKQVDILYVHAPDKTLKPADWAHEMDRLHKEGKFKRFGISNFTPAVTEELHAYCKAHGLVLPTVYQGNYNAVSRLVDTTLFPLLRRLDMAFYAYSAIAGGFLTKTRKALEEGSADGRFAAGDNRIGNLYRKFYLKPAMLDGLARWEELAKIQGVPQAELACRWVYCHSAMDVQKGDQVIVGASKTDQLVQTVDGLKRGPLKPEVVKGIDELWDVVKHEAIIDNYDATGGDLVGK